MFVEKDFNPFLKHYISKYARQSIFTIDFKETLYDFFKDSVSIFIVNTIYTDALKRSISCSVLFLFSY